MCLDDAGPSRSGLVCLWIFDVDGFVYGDAIGVSNNYSVGHFSGAASENTFRATESRGKESWQMNIRRRAVGYDHEA